MVNQEQLFKSLDGLGVKFFTGVPVSLLNDFCLYMVNNIPDYRHVMAANEGNAVAIAAGHYMATGDIPVVYMQLDSKRLKPSLRMAFRLSYI